MFVLATCGDAGAGLAGDASAVTPAPGAGAAAPAARVEGGSGGWSDMGTPRSPGSESAASGMGTPSLESLAAKTAQLGAGMVHIRPTVLSNTGLKLLSMTGACCHVRASPAAL